MSDDRKRAMNDAFAKLFENPNDPRAQALSDAGADFIKSEMQKPSRFREAFIMKPAVAQTDIDRIRGLLETVFSPFDRDIMEQALEALEDKYGLNPCPSTSSGDRCCLKKGHKGRHEAADTGGAHVSWGDEGKAKDYIIR